METYNRRRHRFDVQKQFRAFQLFNRLPVTHQNEYTTLIKFVGLRRLCGVAPVIFPLFGCCRRVISVVADPKPSHPFGFSARKAFKYCGKRMSTHGRRATPSADISKRRTISGVVLIATSRIPPAPLDSVLQTNSFPTVYAYSGRVG